MGINIGTTGVGKIYVGTESIGKVYVGTQLVWQSGVAPTANYMTQTAGNVYPNTNQTITGVCSFSVAVTDDDLTNGTYAWYAGNTNVVTTTHGDTSTVSATNGNNYMSASGNTMSYTNNFNSFPFTLNVGLKCIFTDNTGLSKTSNIVYTRWNRP